MATFDASKYNYDEYDEKVFHALPEGYYLGVIKEVSPKRFSNGKPGMKIVWSVLNPKNNKFRDVWQFQMIDMSHDVSKKIFLDLVYRTGNQSETFDYADQNDLNRCFQGKICKLKLKVDVYNGNENNKVHYLTDISNTETEMVRQALIEHNAAQAQQTQSTYNDAPQSSTSYSNAVVQPADDDDVPF